ncbi:hypothetical protein, conserved in T. vivax [Trypanosoma vivax Y486]|uniref:Uncharacterized protein n=1 Tax=Trypanosoma vivax (strain Y486) TaxID=1055687 RepID=F9WQE8_TRYVY|nr:hypothetical protein, conserved in T. vivax [Trypanosoma vivax Y486]|eukprot:CCD19776.1 hypothetical protein, conserved in T. vivax [Trypanosoma vivax Y486]
MSVDELVCSAPASCFLLSAFLRVWCVSVVLCVVSVLRALSALVALTSAAMASSAVRVASLSLVPSAVLLRQSSAWLSPSQAAVSASLSACARLLYSGAPSSVKNGIAASTAALARSQYLSFASRVAFALLTFASSVVHSVPVPAPLLAQNRIGQPHFFPDVSPEELSAAMTPSLAVQLAVSVCPTPTLNANLPTSATAALSPRLFVSLPAHFSLASVFPVLMHCCWPAAAP